MKSTIIILAFGVLIVVSYKPRKIKVVEINYPVGCKLTKMDAG